MAKRYSHCINMLPFTPVTEALLSPTFVAEEWPLLNRAVSQRGVLGFGVGVAPKSMEGGDEQNGPPMQPQWAGFVYQVRFFSVVYCTQSCKLKITSHFSCQDISRI